MARAVERHVLPLLAAGTVRVPVDATFPMAEAAAAYERFAAGGKLGKVVLRQSRRERRVLVGEQHRSTRCTRIVHAQHVDHEGRGAPPASGR